GCVTGMMSLVEATPMSRRTRMAPRCIGPENFRGAMLALLQCSHSSAKPIDARCKKKAPGVPGLAVIPARRRLIRYFDCVPPYRLDCLVTIRGEVSPGLRFVEGLGLLKTIPLR